MRGDKARFCIAKAAAREGLALCPETVVCFGALDILLHQGAIKPDERILIFNTGASQKYPEAVREKLGRIEIRQPIDWSRI